MSCLGTHLLGQTGIEIESLIVDLATCQNTVPSHEKEHIKNTN